MKIGNTVFFGAMAAILMSTGANAAITQIASTDYVDSVVGTLSETVTNLADDIDAVAGAVNDINDTIGDGTMMVGGTPVDTIVNAINALDAKSVDAYTKAEADAAFATKAELETKANTEDLGALATMNTVGTDQIDDDAVVETKLSPEVRVKLNSALTDANLENVLTKDSLKGYTGKTDMAIPQPSDECRSASGTCVLTVNTSGTLEWMTVTAPTME